MRVTWRGKRGARVKGERGAGAIAAIAAPVALAALGCSKPPPSVAPPVDAAPAAVASAGAPCGSAPMTVHFYDVGQALAALVDLPDGRHVLVDTGDEPRRSGCGDACARASEHLVYALRRDLRGAPIDLVWITHQHSDHIGGVPEVLAAFPARVYVDDGRDGARGEVRRARRSAEERAAEVKAIEPGRADPPLPASQHVTLTAVVPPAWPPACAHDANECSIALRIQYCSSSVLFTGDAEHEEEGMLDPGGPVTLLQVAHHGSETSTSPAFLSRARPRYAVISAGRPSEGTNREYCHPRAIIVKRLTRVLGGRPGPDLEVFDGDRCDRAVPSDWIHVPASDRLWSTSRDGDVVLRTTGDGVFERVAAPTGG
jgi:competence protein ComEC